MVVNIGSQWLQELENYPGPVSIGGQPAGGWIAQGQSRSVASQVSCKDAAGRLASKIARRLCHGPCPTLTLASLGNDIRRVGGWDTGGLWVKFDSRQGLWANVCGAMNRGRCWREAFSDCSCLVSYHNSMSGSQWTKEKTEELTSLFSTIRAQLTCLFAERTPCGYPQGSPCQRSSDQRGLCSSAGLDGRVSQF